jgi:hypothetical protein
MHLPPIHVRVFSTLTHLARYNHGFTYSRPGLYVVSNYRVKEEYLLLSQFNALNVV